MKTYKVKVIYIYSDTVEVEAETKEQAEKIGLEQAEEDCDFLSDIIVTEIKRDI